MFEFDDLDKLSKRLNKLAKNAREINGENKVSFAELFTEDFMSKYTNFSSFDELLKAGNFIVNSTEDFKAIPDDEFDKHIRSVTKFSSWKEMLEKASAEWVEKKLFKD